MYRSVLAEAFTDRYIFCLLLCCFFCWLFCCFFRCCLFSCFFGCWHNFILPICIIYTIFEYFVKRLRYI
jgi:hypothetical protein